MERQDQTRGPIGEAAIEFIIRKKPEAQPQLLMEARVLHQSAKPKIALHRPGAIGDIIMTLSLVPLLKQKYPDHEIHYFCNFKIGKSLAQLMKAAGVDRVGDSATLSVQSGYDQIINLIGYPLADGYPDKPMAKHLIEYFAGEMGLTLDTPEIPHLRLNPSGMLAGLPNRYATIHPQAGWSHYKNWPMERWEKVIASRPDIPFFQIGAQTDHKLLGADHRLMGTDLNVSIALMAHASLHLGIDSWTNHLTNIEWVPRGFVPSIILWGSTQAAAAGYPRNTNISLGLHCQPCFREDPKISRMPRGPCINPPGQDYDKPHHACMAGISVDLVLADIEKLLPSK
jgi:ADP-heptose:LPS heptosyltransferase